MQDRAGRGKQESVAEAPVKEGPVLPEGGQWNNTEEMYSRCHVKPEPQDMGQTGWEPGTVRGAHDHWDRGGCCPATSRLLHTAGPTI